MIEEVRTAALDRFADTAALGEAINSLAENKGAFVCRLARISVYLANDGASEIEAQLAEIVRRIDIAVERPEAGRE
ncbi:hypothetical protein [Paraburkholderia solisilvae]|uniref:hypothetical protein n=1 Tax=Paraburkholderia solisilvae TaxID=624376 RepID=UPI001581ACE3|nr:hypothetical protein [Paraburkholderia solisilvae]